MATSSSSTSRWAGPSPERSRASGPPWRRPSPVSCTSSRVAAVTSVPRCTVTPRSRRASSTNRPAAGSVPGSSRSPRTSRVTVLPSAAIQVAASVATTPPPTIARRSGTSRTPVASREVHAPSPCSAGGTVGVEPVASTTACRAVTRTGCSPSTVTSRSPLSRPWPRSTRIPAPSAQSAWLESSYWCTQSSRRRSSSAARREPGATPSMCAEASASARGRSSAFEGMQA